MFPMEKQSTFKETSNVVQHGKCPVCDGKRGRVIAVIDVERINSKGANYRYRRFTHTTGKKRKYCYFALSK